MLTEKYKTIHLISFRIKDGMYKIKCNLLLIVMEHNIHCTISAPIAHVFNQVEVKKLLSTFPLKHAFNEVTYQLNFTYYLIVISAPVAYFC